MAYDLEKYVWSESDFNSMGWHDCKIHAITYFPESRELILDIDYLFEWVKPNEDTYYKFWISPATMVFECASEVDCNLRLDLGLEIAGIFRTESNASESTECNGFGKSWNWEISCTSGSITLKSTGYKMFVRALPKLESEQSIAYEKRGGVSFSRKIENA
jgi:hypothetical protein